MLEKMKLLQYGAQVKLHGSDKEFMINADGRQTQVLRGGKGEPLVYLHSAIGETLWLPFHQTLSDHFDLIAPAPGFGQSAGYEEIDNIEDVVFHYLDLSLSLSSWIVSIRRQLAWRMDCRRVCCQVSRADQAPRPGRCCGPLAGRMADSRLLRQATESSCSASPSAEVNPIPSSGNCCFQPRRTTIASRWHSRQCRPQRARLESVHAQSQAAETAETNHFAHPGTLGG